MADKFGKFAKQAISIFHDVGSWECNKDKIAKWQVWLAHVNAKLGELSSNENHANSVESHHDFSHDFLHPKSANSIYCVPSDMTFEHPIEAFRNLLPKWGWNHTDFAFDWIPSFPDQVVLKSYASTSPNNWKIAVSFLKNLTWDSCSTHKTAYIEIAFEDWYSGVRFEGINATPKEYPCMIRKCINQCVKLQHHGKIVQGDQKSG